VAAQLDAGHHAGRDAVEAADRRGVDLLRFEELRLLGRHGEVLVLDLRQHGGAAAALVGGLPLRLDVLNALFREPLVAVEVAARNCAVAEEAGAVLLGGDAQPDRLSGVGDRGQPFQLAGPGVGADVPEVGAVLPLPGDADHAAAVLVADGDGVRVDEVDLGGQQPGAGPGR
jgi:hypothetical protein